MPELYPDDQKKVDEYIQSNVNATERSDFKPFRLLAIIFVVLGLLTLVSFLVAMDQGLV